MKPIKLYFAGSWTFKDSDNRMNYIVPNRVASYAYPEQFDQWIELNKCEESNIIIDSGAFSAWNNGKTIDIDDYIEYCHNCIEKGSRPGRNIHIVNLDVIPGKVGESKSLGEEAKEKAAKEGFENLKIMQKNGLDPMHVFHQGEGFKWLDKMLEEVSYIGISPANDMSNKDKIHWMESVFDYLYENGMSHIDTHGFAVMSLKALRNFPWTSCDAASWKLLAAYGKVLYPATGFSSNRRILYQKDFTTLDISSQKNSEEEEKEEKENSKGFFHVPKDRSLLSDEEIRLLEKDGYDYEELRNDHEKRAEVNIRFVLKLQEDLNHYKQNKTYSIKNRLTQLKNQ